MTDAASPALPAPDAIGGAWASLRPNPLAPEPWQALTEAYGTAGLAPQQAYVSSHNPHQREPQPQRHQLLITGNARDSLTVHDGTWTRAGTTTATGAFNGTYNVWDSSTGLSQLLVNSSLTTSGL